MKTVDLSPDQSVESRDKNQTRLVTPGFVARKKLGDRDDSEVALIRDDSKPRIFAEFMKQRGKRLCH